MSEPARRQAYSAAFARAYELGWTTFTRKMAPRLLELYQSTPHGRGGRAVIDLGCGSGHLALHFLEHGHQVLGVDLSPAMLALARERASEYLRSGQAEFVEADMASFTAERRFGLAVSTYDAINHLPDEAALGRCFAAVRRVLAPDGMLVFDLNTRKGLRRWNSVTVEDSEEITVINRGFFDEDEGRAYVRISGFIRKANGSYDRFEETAFNTAFDLRRVEELLVGHGFDRIYCATPDDLTRPLESPEKLEEQDRILFVARTQSGGAATTSA